MVVIGARWRPLMTSLGLAWQCVMSEDRQSLDVGIGLDHVQVQTSRIWLRWSYYSCRDTAGGGWTAARADQNHELSRVEIGVGLTCGGRKKKSSLVAPLPPSEQAVNTAGRQGPASSSRQARQGHYSTGTQSNLLRLQGATQAICPSHQVLARVIHSARSVWA